eukprot:7146547-Pyramimonas_sp.AAC.1
MALFSAGMAPASHCSPAGARLARVSNHACGPAEGNARGRHFLLQQWIAMRPWRRRRTLGLQLPRDGTELL